MVYAGEVGEQEVTFGVSGRLRNSNLVMWDPETGSLWSQMLGEALHGPLKGRRLGRMPAQLVGLGTWKRLHPATVVLDLPPVRQAGWHFTNEVLERGHVRGRRGRQPLAIGLREGGEALAVSLYRLHEQGLVETSLGGVPVLLVWIPEEKAVFVYRRSLQDETLSLRRSLRGKARWKDDSDTTWDLFHGRALSGPRKGSELPRLPYIPTYRDAWTSHFPDSRILD